MYYLAPMEGLTDHIYRRAHFKYFDGVDKYFTPFISPNGTMNFTTREKKEFSPENNKGMRVIPQLLTKNAEHFLWAAHELYEIGYTEINLNLGCPSGTVTAKGKGSGFLCFPEELDKFLEEIFNGLDKGQKLSIKTRLGKASPEEFYPVMDIYNKYPIEELIVHPRIQKDFYREPLRMEYFDYAATHSKNVLCYNGELKSETDIENIKNKYPNVPHIMIGRGLITHPAMLMTEKLEDADYRRRIRGLFDDLFNEYSAVLSGEKHVLCRLKEYWLYMALIFEDYEKPLKRIKKTQKLSECRLAAEEILARPIKKIYCLNEHSHHRYRRMQLHYNVLS